MPRYKRYCNFIMEKSKSGFCLAEVVSGENKTKSTSSIGVNARDGRGYSLSPPASADNTGAPTTGCSTGDGSVFTFNSVTDDSSEPSSPATRLEDGTTFVPVGPTRKNSDALCDRKIKMMVRKEYTHVVRYDYQSLLKRLKEIQTCEDSLKNNCSIDDGKNKLENGSSRDTVAISSLNSPGVANEGPRKAKSSAKMLKNFFSIVTSPISERRTDKSLMHNHHRKRKSKSSSSPSLTKEDRTRSRVVVEGPKDEGKSTRSMLEIKRDGLTI